MLERQVVKLSNTEHRVLIALNHHKVLVLIQEAGETSKLSSGLHGVEGTCSAHHQEQLGRAPLSHRGLNGVGAAHVAKKLSALFLHLLTCLSHRPLLESKGSLAEKLQVLLPVVLIGNNHEYSARLVGWAGGFSFVQHLYGVRVDCRNRASAQWEDN